MFTELFEVGRKFLARSREDVEPILEHNKALRSQEQKSDWGRHVASVPNIVLMKWLNEELDRGHEIRPFSPEFYELVAQKLRDPDWAHLRVDGPQSRAGWGT